LPPPSAPAVSELGVDVDKCDSKVSLLAKTNVHGALEVLSAIDGAVVPAERPVELNSDTGVDPAVQEPVEPYHAGRLVPFNEHPIADPEFVVGDCPFGHDLL